MDIRPNLPIAGVAGTARSQSKGTDSNRPPSGGGVAESQQINDNAGLHEGSRSEDRDADGRQLLAHQPKREQEEDDTPEGEHETNQQLRSHRPPSTDPHRGHKLDFDA